MNGVKLILSKFFFVICYLTMIGMNFGANRFLLNGTTTGEVTKDMNLSFEPAGFTFSIWGLIYLLQFASIFSYLKWTKKETERNQSKDPAELLLGSGLVCLLNMMWILFWHYKLWIGTAVILACMCIVLCWINYLIKYLHRNGVGYYVIKASNQIYLAWATIAFILDLFIVLIQEKVIGTEISEVTVTIGVLVLSCFLGLGILLWVNSLWYGAVYLWAYMGILLNHLTNNGWNGFADTILFALCIAMVVITVGMCLVIYRNFRIKNAEE